MRQHVYSSRHAMPSNVHNMSMLATAMPGLRRLAFLPDKRSVGTSCDIKVFGKGHPFILAVRNGMTWDMLCFVMHFS